MTVLLLEDNLLWSERLRKSLEALGHTVQVVPRPLDVAPSCDVAIVNLGSRAFPPEEWIGRLRTSGVKVVAHAGHKEVPLLDVGRDCGADLVVTNSELTHRPADVLGRLAV
ncbi:MAG: hypothetical protein JST30_08180 [Armatimonadetes bacterium]|nr:hypothetical protein [Armatimonadota bacterium]